MNKWHRRRWTSTPLIPGLPWECICQFGCNSLPHPVVRWARNPSNSPHHQSWRHRYANLRHSRRPRSWPSPGTESLVRDGRWLNCHQAVPVRYSPSNRPGHPWKARTCAGCAHSPTPRQSTRISAPVRPMPSGNRSRVCRNRCFPSSSRCRRWLHRRCSCCRH